MVHNGKNLYECHECDSRYQSKKDLINHLMKIHVEESPENEDEKLLKCENLKVFTEIVQEGKEPFECDFCNRSFATEKAKIFHTKRIHNETHSGHIVKPQFKSNICKSKFSQISHLDKHLTEHNENDSYECEICDTKYHSKEELIDHVMKVHVGESPEKKVPEKLFKCEKCDATFLFHYKLKIHVETAHELEKPFKCEMCDKSYMTKSGLNYHIAIGHEGNLRFRCEKCGKGFTQKCSLEKHIGSVHEATNMPFQCNKCNIKFPRKNGKDSLSYHIALTHQELTCNICFISFPTNYDLQEHIKAHDGKEPFNCNICNTKLINHQDLMKHASTVHVGAGNIN